MTDHGDGGVEREVPERDDKPEDRLDWFLSSRRNERGELDSGIIARASRQRREAERRLRDGAEGGSVRSPPGGGGAVNWTPIGPSAIARGQATGHPPTSGRITGLAVGPLGFRAYAGAANGGPWFTGDAGATWSPLDDYSTSFPYSSGAEADSLSVGAIAVSFGASAATDTVYVGTGEPNQSIDAYFGVGIRRSPNGGAPSTWSLEATNLAGWGIHRIVIDPDDPTIVFAATTQGLFQRPLSGSVATWTLVTSSSFTQSTGKVCDLIVAGSGTSKQYYAAFDSDNVYRSPDGTTGWVPLAGLPPGSTNTGGVGRLALAAGESDPSVVYALAQNTLLYRLVGGGFEAVSGAPFVFQGFGGWYAIVLAVDPADADTVFLAGTWTYDTAALEYNLSLYRGQVTGSPGSYQMTSTWNGVGIHPDGHAFAFALDASGTSHDGSQVWVGTDGGVFVSSANGDAGTFQARNKGLAVIQMTFLDQWPGTDAVVFAGSQDNGGLRYLGEQAWAEASFEGDGGGVAVDRNNPYRVMQQYVRSSLYRSFNAGRSWFAVPFPILPNTAEGSLTGFYAPIAVSPEGFSPTVVAFGTKRLWLSADWGSSWLSIPSNTAADALDGQPVVAIEFPTPDLIFAATKSKVVRFDRSGGTWTATPITTSGFTYAKIADLSVEDAALGTFYAASPVTTSGSCAWYYDGSAWVSAGPPLATLAAPAHAVEVDPDNPATVYLGTDVGCWRGTKTGAATWTWAIHSQGLPEVAITDLAVHRPSRVLRAATHGRGVWEIPLDATSGADPDLYLRADYADNGRVVGGIRFPFIQATPDPTFDGFGCYPWMSPDIKVRRPSLLSLPPLGAQADYVDFAVNIGDWVDTTTDMETADETGTNRIFVEVHNRGLTAVPGADVRVLLLIADASAGLPTLPASYAAEINAGSTANWLAGSGWSFADPIMPYRLLTGELGVRTPQVAEYSFDFSTLGLPAGDDHVCALAFAVTTNSVDQLVSMTPPTLGNLIWHDKHVALRNLHLVAAGVKPSPHGTPPGRPGPRTIVVDFHNPAPRTVRADLIFDRHGLPGTFSFALSKRPRGSRPYGPVEGGRVVDAASLDPEVRAHLDRWTARVRELEREAHGSSERQWDDRRRRRVNKLARIDLDRIYSADGAETVTVRDVAIPPGRAVTALATLHLPPGTQPGARFRFDVLQRQERVLVGGSSYVVLVRSDDARSRSAPVRQRG